MIFVSNFSGGLCSFFATERIVQAYGPACVRLLFADTLVEDDDLYTFNQQASALLGVPITRVSRELTPWDLFQREGLIANNGAPICSIQLKREPLNAWMLSHHELANNQPNMLLEDATVVLGFDHTEHHRVVEFQQAHPTWRVVAPMARAPFWDKCRMMAEAEKRGLIVPQLYSAGFPHNNCGGCCVRAGITHWVKVLKVYPKRYASWEAKELETQQVFKARGVSNWQFTILRDRRGGDTKPLSLRDLRLRVEAGEKFPTDEWGGCGCGGAT